MASEKPSNEIPPSIKLRSTLKGHRGVINRIAWSPDGKMLASPSSDKTIRLVNLDSGKLHKKLIGHKDEVLSVA